MSAATVLLLAPMMVLMLAACRMGDGEGQDARPVPVGGMARAQQDHPGGRDFDAVDGLDGGQRLPRGQEGPGRIAQQDGRRGDVVRVLVGEGHPLDRARIPVQGGEAGPDLLQADPRVHQEGPLPIGEGVTVAFGTRGQGGVAHVPA